MRQMMNLYPFRYCLCNCRIGLETYLDIFGGSHHIICCFQHTIIWAIKTLNLPTHILH